MSPQVISLIMAFMLIALHLMIFFASIHFFKLSISSALSLTGLTMNTIGSILFGIEFLLGGRLIQGKHKECIKEGIPPVSKALSKVMFVMYLKGFIHLLEQKYTTDENGSMVITQEQAKEVLNVFRGRIDVAQSQSDIPKETLEKAHKKTADIIEALIEKNTNETQIITQEQMSEFLKDLEANFEDVEKEIDTSITKIFTDIFESLIKKGIGWFGVSLFVVGFILQIIAILIPQNR